MILLLLILTSKDGLFSREFHFNLLFLNVLKAFNLILLIHFRFPAVELGSIFQTHGHLVELGLLLPLFEINEMFFSFQSSDIQLDICIILIEVGHPSWLSAFELKLFDDLLLDELLHPIGLRNRGSAFCSQCKSLLGVAFIFALNGIDGCLSSLLFVVFNVSERLFVHALREWPCLYFSFDLFRRRNHLRPLPCQIERLELSFFRLLLLFTAFREDFRHASVMG